MYFRELSCRIHRSARGDPVQEEQLVSGHSQDIPSPGISIFQGLLRKEIQGPIQPGPVPEGPIDEFENERAVPRPKVLPRLFEIGVGKKAFLRTMKDLDCFLPRLIDMLHEICTAKTGRLYGKKYLTAACILKSVSIRVCLRCSLTRFTATVREEFERLGNLADVDACIVARAKGTVI